MKILFLGPSNPAVSTSGQRAEAFKRIGQTVCLRDPYVELGLWKGRWPLTALNCRTGYRLQQPNARRWARRLVSDTTGVDLVWIEGGELFGTKALAELKRLRAPIVLFNPDDPTGLRDRRRFDSLREALHLYDLCVFPIRDSVPDSEYLAYGVKKVLRVWFRYDEVAHQPFDDEAQIPAEFRSDVAFVGTWIRGDQRDRFIWELLQRRIAVNVWGNRWQKSPYWKEIRSVWRGPAVYGRDYVAAIQGAKISLGLLCRRNRDGHTTRSLEITYAGGVLCGERTPEHLRLYREGEEAIFWGDAAECAEACRRLLQDAAFRQSIRQRGHQRALQLRLGHEPLCRSILDEIERSRKVSPV
jgi:spore maturation protein CgeB